MLRQVLFAASLCLSTACHAAPTESEFTREIFNRVRASTPDKTVRIKPDEPLVILIDAENDRHDRVINLHRIYGYCQSATEADCEATKAEFLGKISIGPPPAKREKLRLIVRDQVYVDYVEQAFKDVSARPPYRAIGDRVYAIVAIDGPDTIALATKPVLDEMHLQPEEAWDIAARQTKAILPKITPGSLRKNKAVAFQDFEYLASLMADIEQWRPIAAEFGPDLFVTAVSDNFVFVGLMPDGLRFDAFKKTVDDDCKAQQRCVLPFIYRFRDGRWVVAR